MQNTPGLDTVKQGREPGEEDLSRIASSDGGSDGGMRHGPYIKEESFQGFFDQLDIRKVFLGIRRRLWFVLAMGLVFSVFFGVVSFVFLNKFTATSLLLHVRQVPERHAAGYTAPSFNPQTIVEMLRQPQHYQAAKSILGLDLSVAEVASMVNMQSTRTSNLLALSVTSDSESLSVDLANTLSQVAVKSSKDLHFRQAQQAFEYFTNESEEVRKRLLDLGRQINDYKSEHQLFEVDQEGVVASGLQQLQKILQQANIEYQTLLVEYENLKREIEEMPDMVIRYQYEESPLRGRIASTEMTLLDARTRFGPDNPKVLQIEEELRQLRKMASDGEYSESREQIYEKNTLKEQQSVNLMHLEGKVRAAKKRKEALTEELNRGFESYDDVPREQMMLAQLVQRREAVRNELESLESARRSAEVAMETRRGDIEIYQSAERARPAGGFIVRFLPLIGFFLGCAGAVFIVLMMELADRRLRTNKQIDLAYSVPSILGVPEITNLSDDNGDEAFLFFTRALAERLERVARPRTLKSVVFSSAVSGEGKTSLAYHLARYYNRLGVKTVFVEFDYRRNRYTGESSTSPENIEKYLRGEVALADIIAPGKPDYLKAGYDSDMKELVQNGYMSRLWETLTSSYDLVIVDAPGLIDDDYALNVAELAEDNVFIVNSQKTRRAYVDASLQLLEQSGVRPRGIVLNQMLPLYIEDPRIKRQWDKENWGTLSKFLPWG